MTAIGSHTVSAFLMNSGSSDVSAGLSHNHMQLSMTSYSNRKFFIGSLCKSVQSNLTHNNTPGNDKNACLKQVLAY